MSDIILKAENISKQYRLGLVGTGTLSHDLNRWWHKIRGKEDPFLKVGDINDRTRKGVSDYVWALKDINFEVERGQVLGIIGKNGAGKSTLLKILSRVTSPTTGIIKSKGRIASLLEVGTGFHPEMTGRANIFLNGAILGMSKKEISSKLDEIVAFSGCERYLDTPVKRYSSGMTVRLAFAVAAHLEPEILIVDEVLAVGDAEFQKKCLGKMKEVSKGGRTILFVSHNMLAIKNICNRVMYMQNGSVKNDGLPDDVISSYINSNKNSSSSYDWSKDNNKPGNEYVKVNKIKAYTDDLSSNIMGMTKPFKIEVEVENLVADSNLSITIQVANENEIIIFGSGTGLSYPNQIYQKGFIYAACHVPGNLLNIGIYSVNLLVVKDGSKVIYLHPNIVSFEISNIDENRQGWYGKSAGVIQPILNWECIYTDKDS